jgi:hypothetical protein
MIEYEDMYFLLLNKIDKRRKGLMIYPFISPFEYFLMKV